MIERVMSTAVSGLFALLYAGGFVTNSENTTVAPVHAIRDDGAGCDWYHVNVNTNTMVSCDSFSMRRGMSTQYIRDFRDRAMRCASLHGVSCILSHEVGIDIPAYFFVEHPSDAIVVFPQVRKVASFDQTVPVMHVNPNEPGERVVVDLFERVRVEYLDQSHTNIDRTVEDKEAFCAQMLARSVPRECLVDHTDF